MRKSLFIIGVLCCVLSTSMAQVLLTGTGYGSMAGKGDGWGDAQPVFAFNGLTNMGNQVDYNSNDVNNMPWIALALPSSTQITRIRVLPRQEYTVTGTDTTWSTWMYQYLEGAKLQASNDSLFSSPVDLATIGTVSNSHWQEFQITDVTKYKYVRILNTKTFITFTQLQFYGIDATPPQIGKTVYIPNDWKIAANDIQWDSVNRMKQSPNCVVFWGPLAGNDPTVATPTTLRFNPQTILDSMEGVYHFMMDSMKIIPDSGQWAKYKLIIVMNNTWRDGLLTGWAFGGAYDNKVPAMWVDPGVFAQNAWTVTHEFTHTIQAMITSVMYPGHGYPNTNSGFFWETHANFMAFQRYPSFATAADLPRAINLSSYFIGSGRKHYSQFYFLQQMKDDYGINFVSRLWRESNAAGAETPLEAARRLMGMDQTAFNDYMMKYAARSVKWDFSNKSYMQAAENSLDRVWRFRKTVILDSVSEGHFAIPDNQAPQQYGFNIIRLYPQKEDGCSQPYVYMKFKGHKDANASSGWRYAFVTVDSTTAASSFSPFYKEDSTEITYTIPANTRETYLVVMGAPTQMHFQSTNIFEPGFTKIYRYPWEIQIQGAVPEGYQNGFRSIDTVGLTGARHANGGGWVARTASVDASAYVAPGAYVLDRARVTGNARIEGKAELRDDVTISGNAVVKDFAIVGGNSRISGNAVISNAATVYFTTVADNAKVSEGAFLMYNNLSGSASVYGNAFSTGSTSLSGSIKIGGDAEIGGTCSAGTYLQCYGITNGTNTRTECDGSTTSPLNTDINLPYSVFDEGGMSFSKIVACGDSIGKASLPPVISLTSLITLQLPINSAQLNASATDPDGTVATYSWTKAAGPDTYTFSSPAQANTTVSNLVAGTYVFALTAKDNSGMKATAKVTVIVLKSNDVPVVSVGADITVTLPVNYVTLTATAGDPDGYIDSVRWYRVSGDAGSFVVSPGSMTTTVRNLVEGKYQFAFRATDNGGVASEGTVRVQVLAATGNNLGATGSTTLKLSPNPTAGMVYLTFPIVTGGSIILYDTRGRTLQVTKLVPGAASANLNLSSFSAGLYYIRVITNNGDKYKTTITILR